MLSRIIVIPFIIILTGCNESANEKSYQNADTLSHKVISDKIITDSVLVKQNEPDFDVNKFIALAEPFLTKIIGKNIHCPYAMDTITAGKVDEDSYLYALNPSDKTLIQRYVFYPDGHFFYHFSLTNASYSDTNDLNRAFKTLQVQSMAVDSTDHLPGLTYTNDNVIKTDKRIYWINSGCQYAYYSHKKLCDIFRQCLRIENVTDSIRCECGMPKCKL